MGRGPALEQIENHDYPTIRVVAAFGGREVTHGELLESREASALAHHVWATQQPLDEVRVVNERTGFTRDVISRG